MCGCFTKKPLLHVGCFICPGMGPLASDALVLLSCCRSVPLGPPRPQRVEFGGVAMRACGAGMPCGREICTANMVGHILLDGRRIGLGSSCVTRRGDGGGGGGLWL